MPKKPILTKVVTALQNKTQCKNFIKMMLGILEKASETNIYPTIVVTGPILLRNELKNLRKHKDILDPSVWMHAIGDPNGDYLTLDPRADAFGRFTLAAIPTDPPSDPPHTPPPQTRPPQTHPPLPSRYRPPSPSRHRPPSPSHHRPPSPSHHRPPNPSRRRPPNPNHHPSPSRRRLPGPSRPPNQREKSANPGRPNPDRLNPREKSARAPLTAQNPRSAGGRRGRLTHGADATRNRLTAL